MRGKIKYGMSACIGETLIGLPYPVFFDPHYPILTNRPPVTLITGEPGSGKTFATSILAAHSTVMNKVTVGLDPKGDLTSLKLLERAGHIDNVSIWSVFKDIDNEEVNEDNIGMLDPLTLTSNVSDNVGFAIEVINMLVKNVSNKQNGALIPILRDVAESDAPSLKKVALTLMRNKDPDISALGHELDVPLSTPIAKLLVSSTRHQHRLDIAEGTTIVSLMGLSLPSSNKKRENYSQKERLSVCVMNMVTHLILDIMKTLPKSTLKTLIIDEAWSVFATESGSALIDQVTLLGRSLNMATLLVTQSPLHIKSKDGGASLDTTISTRIAFRNSSSADNIETARAMKLPENMGSEEIFEVLQSGQCVITDCQGQTSFVSIVTSPEWADVFSTTPSPDRK